MSQSQLLARVVSVLESVSVPYMITGSLVSSALGEPRMTHDIDIVVRILPSHIADIQKAFDAENYAFDDLAAHEAIKRGDQFQLMEYASGDKIDFWIFNANDAHDRSMFDRRLRTKIAGVSTLIPTAEDIILRKLLWAHLYESEKQFGDALGVYELQYVKLDMGYIKHWVVTMDLGLVWERLQTEAEPLKE